MKNRKLASQNNNITAGVIILLIGAALMLRAMGIWFPGWFISWPMIFIAIGLFSLIKTNFKSEFGFVMFLVGSFILFKREVGFPEELQPFVVPGGLILLGIYLIIKQQDNRKRFNSEFLGQQPQSPDPGNPAPSKPVEPFTSHVYTDMGETVNAQAFFCGINKRVLSKNFRGGKTSAIFGGTEIDLSQADLAPGAVLNVEVAFGGVKLIVPPHWDLQINVSNIFAGVEDKRLYPQTPADSTKVLRIYGSIIFGGLEIKSF